MTSTAFAFSPTGLEATQDAGLITPDSQPSSPTVRLLHQNAGFESHDPGKTTWNMDMLTEI